MKIEEIIPVDFKGQDAELVTISEIRVINTGSRIHSKRGVKVFETRLHINNEYFMTVSCGLLKGESKKAICNRISLKNQYGITLK